MSTRPGEDATPVVKPAAGIRRQPDRLPDHSPAARERPAPHRAPARPVHLHWRYVGMVALGGAFGTGGREALTLAIPSIGAFPVATFTINLAGAFLLGFLLAALTRRGPDEGGRRTLRLLLGSGFLGGFTTYSTLATDTALLTAAGSLGLALAYSLGTLVVGAAASWAGIVVAARLRGPVAVTGEANG